MDDDEIAFLRLTALKSLNAKKEADLQIQASKALAATKRRSRSPSDSPPSKYSHHSTTRIPSNDYLAPGTKSLSYRSGHYGNSVAQSHVSPVLDTYVTPQHWTSVGSNRLQLDYHSPGTYVPTKMPSSAAAGYSQVQLSPRSAAFVLQNNDILARRTGSPPSHPTFSRWSDSPSPPLNHYTSNSHRISPLKRGDVLSRSPEKHPKNSRSTIRRSPSFHRDAGSSRSPPSHNRRYASRSPPPLAPASKREPRCRSPGHRNRTPQANHHRTSPPPARRRSPIGARSPNSIRPHPKNTIKSGSTISQFRHKSSDRNTNSGSSVPFQAKTSGNRRRSRSPRRKSSRSCSPVGSKTSRAARPASSRRDNIKHNERPTNRSERPQNAEKSYGSGPRARSRSPKNNKTSNNVQPPSKDSGKAAESPKEEVKVPTATAMPAESVRTAATSESEDTKTNEPRKMVSDDPTDVSDDDQPHNDDDDDDDDAEQGDEIDLFASDESESENEGRFKCRSNKPERDPTVPAVSFASLVTGSRPPGQAAVIDSNLDDISSSLGISVPDNRNRERRDRNGRRRRKEPPHNSGNARGRHRSDRNHHGGDRSGGGRYESSRNNRPAGIEGDSVRNSPARGKSIHRRSADRQTNESANRAASSGVDDQMRTVEPPRKGSVQSKRNDEQSASVLKSTVSSTVSSVRSNKTTAPAPTPPTAPTKSRSTAAEEPSTTDRTQLDETAAAAKKAIHSRLGAMTNTWKNSKKTWSSSSSPEKTTINQRGSK